jgi:hypothetical protein
VFAEQPDIDPRRQILATRRSQFETVLDRRMTSCAASSLRASKKKSRARSPALKIASTLFPRRFDLILIDGATLLVRARAPPETRTTRLQPFGQPEPALVDHLFRLVTIFSNDCSKFEQIAKSLGLRHSGLHFSAGIEVWVRG